MDSADIDPMCAIVSTTELRCPDSVVIKAYSGRSIDPVCLDSHRGMH